MSLLTQRYSMLGKKVQLMRVGGKIFYIDETATGASYTFYDEQKNVLSDVQVGDEPYYYSISGVSNKDKFYIASPTRVFDSNLIWGNEGISVGTAYGFGFGKPNTNSVYSKFTSSELIGTVFGYLSDNINGVLYQGNSDWYIPSSGEVLLLRNARDRDGNALYTYASQRNTTSTEMNGNSPTHAVTIHSNGSYDNQHKDHVNSGVGFAIRSF